MEEFIFTPDQKEAKKGLVDFIKTSKNLIATLYGPAGTGKTTVLRYVLGESEIPQGRIAVSAPTHQAKKVIAKATSLQAVTIQSLLGLRPDTNLEYFDITRPIFNPLAEESIGRYKLIVVDEASMLGKDIFKLLVDKARNYNVKIIFMGDRLQLPPIGEFVSKIFTDCEEKFELTTIKRQGENNPNSELLQILREDVTTNMALYEEIYNNLYNKYSYISDENKRIKKALEDALSVSAPYSFKGLEYLTESIIQEDKGFYCLNNNDFGIKMLEYYRSTEYQYDTSHIKYIAYTNKSVVQWCEGIRRALYNKNAEHQLLINEPLIGYSTILKEDDILLQNSEEYNIEYMQPALSSYDIKGFNVKLRSDSHSTNVFIVDKTDYDKFREVAFQLLDNAYTMRGIHWKYWKNFKDNHLLMDDFYKGQRKYIGKDLYYGYGITIHKSQGSTFINSAINLTNIVSINKNISEAARLIYVAMSRCKDVNLILNK